MKIVKDINKHIFRGYDIRGIYNEDLTDDVAYTIGLGIGTELSNLNKNVVVVGHDNRISSVPLSNALIEGLTNAGIDVIDIGLVTTPMLNYACIKYDVVSGVMITASHNPKEYNGFKITYKDNCPLCGEEIQELRALIENFKFTNGQGTIEKRDITDEYINMICEKINLGPRKIKAVVDCGNGTGSIVAQKIFDKLGIEYSPLYCESNGDFPNHHPDPCEVENLVDMQKEVLRFGADIGIGVDGDADRLGIIDEQSNIIAPDFCMIIFARDIIKKVNNKKVIFDVNCSKSLVDEIEKMGGEPIYYKTGDSYIRRKMNEEHALLAGEVSGHTFFADDFFGFDDGIYAGLRVIEILSNTDKKTSQLLDGINLYETTPVFKIDSTDEKKGAIIEKIREYAINKGYKTITIDGARVEFEDGWCIIRHSNTSPKITARFEGDNKEALERIQKEFTEVLEEAIQSV